jgi:hypothetical protein
MKNAISALVTTSPEWMRANALPHWYERFKTGRLSQNQASGSDPDNLVEKANALGADISYLLNTMRRQNFPGLALPEICALARLWEEEYLWVDGAIRWRQTICTNGMNSF